jgi:hypothetical protein
MRIDHPSAAATARAGIVAMACVIAGLPDAAQAQAINVVAPRLPPRVPGAAPAPTPPAQPGTPAGGYGQPATGSPGGAAPAPGYGAQPGYGNAPGYGAQPGYGSAPGTGAQSGTGAPGYGQAPGTPGYGQAPGYGAPPAYGGAPAVRPGGAPPSVLAGRAQQPYAAPPPAGEVQVASVAPTRSTASGHCRADPAPDRQSVSLLGADALPRTHVPLGEYRVQQVIHSPDGRWAVAFTKLRGQPRFAVMTFDLARCEPQNTVDLPAAADDARFDGDDAVVTLASGERRVKLANPRVR